MCVELIFRYGSPDWNHVPDQAFGNSHPPYVDATRVIRQTKYENVPIVLAVIFTGWLVHDVRKNSNHSRLSQRTSSSSAPQPGRCIEPLPLIASDRTRPRPGANCLRTLALITHTHTSTMRARAHVTGADNSAEVQQ